MELKDVLREVVKNPPKKHHRLGISAEPAEIGGPPGLTQLPRFEKDVRWVPQPYICPKHTVGTSTLHMP